MKSNPRLRASTVALGFVLFPLVLVAGCSRGSKGGSGPALAAPELLAYGQPEGVYLLGEPISPNAPVLAGGAPGFFSIDPPLPAGLVLDPTSGVLGGIPTEPQAQAVHTITVSNAAGSSSAEVLVGVAMPELLLNPSFPLVFVAPPGLDAPFAEHVGGLGVDTVGLVPQWTPDPLVGWAPLPWAAPFAAAPDGGAAAAPTWPTIDATEARAVNVALETLHVSTLVAWNVRALDPYEAADADLTGVEVASSHVVSGELRVEIDQPELGIGPFTSDGVPSARFETRLLTRGLGAAVEGPAVVLGDRLALTVRDGEGRGKLLRVDLQSGQANRAADHLPGEDDDAQLFGELDGRWLYRSLNNPIDRAPKLFALGPEDAAPQPLVEIWPHQDETIGAPVIGDGEFFFGAELWHGVRKLFHWSAPHGTEPQVRAAANLSGDFGTTDGAVAQLLLDGDLYFTAAPLYGGRKLFRLHRAEGLVEQITDLRGPGADDGIEHITALAGRVFFRARTWEGGGKLFAFDPASGDLIQVGDLAGGAALDDGIGGILAGETRLFVTAEAAPGERRAFALDPISLEWTALGRTAGESGDDGPELLAAVGDDLYFAARTPEGGIKCFWWRGEDGDLRRLGDAQVDPAADEAPRDVLAFGTWVALVLSTSPGVEKLFLHDPAEGWLVQAADLAGADLDDAPRPLGERQGRLLFSARVAPGEIGLLELAQAP